MNAARSAIAIVPILAVALLLFFVPTVLSDTAEARVDVGNSDPAVTNVKLVDWGAADDDDIDVTAHAYDYRVACNFTVSDINGAADITVPKANISKRGAGIYAADDDDVHYTNASCIYNYSSGTNQLTFSCLFRIQYYADNGTWYCHASAIDTSGGRHNASDSATVVAVTSIQVNTSTGATNDVLDFGSLGVGANSSSAVYIRMINLGNTEIDSELYGTNMTNTSVAPRANFSVMNITFNRTIYAGPTQLGSVSNDPNAAPRKLQESPSPYTWSLDIPDRESTHTDFTDANKTGQFRIIVPSGQASRVYRNTITVNGLAA